MAVQTLLTIDEFRHLPDDGNRYELVEGEVVPMTFPRPRHNRIAGKLYRALHDFVESRALGEVFLPDTGFILGRHPDSLRGPDVAFVRAGRQVEPDQDIEGAPDLAVEVVSPSDTAEELRQKVRQYLNAGSSAVWVIYPKTREIEVYLSNGGFYVRSDDGSLDSPDLLPGFRISVAELFE